MILTAIYWDKDHCSDQSELSPYQKDGKTKKNHKPLTNQRDINRVFIRKFNWVPDFLVTIKWILILTY